MLTRDARVSITCSALASPPLCVLDGGGARELIVVTGGGAVSITGMELRGGCAPQNNGGALSQSGGSVSLAGDLIDHNVAYVRARRPVALVTRLSFSDAKPRGTFLVKCRTAVLSSKPAAAVSTSVTLHSCRSTRSM